LRYIRFRSAARVDVLRSAGSGEVHRAADRSRQRCPQIAALWIAPSTIDAIVANQIETRLLAFLQPVHGDRDLVPAIGKQRHRRVVVAQVFGRREDDEQATRRVGPAHRHLESRAAPLRLRARDHARGSSCDPLRHSATAPRGSIGAGRTRRRASMDLDELPGGRRARDHEGRIERLDERARFRCGVLASRRLARAVHDVFVEVRRNVQTAAVRALQMAESAACPPAARQTPPSAR
jgi:hypothetical protein